MKDLLNSYEKSRALVKERLSQLNSLRREYKHQGNKEAIEQLASVCFRPKTSSLLI